MYFRRKIKTFINNWTRRVLYLYLMTIHVEQLVQETAHNNNYVLVLHILLCISLVISYCRLSDRPMYRETNILSVCRSFLYLDRP